MFIPELDAIIFLATEYLEGSADQPTLIQARAALHQAAGVSSSSSIPKRNRVADALSHRACLDLLQHLGITVLDEDKPMLWEALGGAREVPLVTVGLLLALICQANFVAKTSFVFWLLDKDANGKLTKGDITAAIGPLMHTAQAGMVLMGSSGGPMQEPHRGASIWEDFRDSMRELATDQVAAAIADGAFDEVDAQHTGRIQGPQFRAMLECIATDVATMMVDVTDLQFQAEQASGERLDSSHSAATGVKAALHKLVKKYAGDQTAERLLGAPAKPHRMSGLTAGRRARLGLRSSAQPQSQPSGLASQSSQASYTAIPSQLSAGHAQGSWQQQKQNPQQQSQQLSQGRQQSMGLPGPRYTSTPTLAAQRDQSGFSSDRTPFASTSGSPAQPMLGQGSTASLGITGQGTPSQANNGIQGIPNQADYSTQGIPSHSRRMGQIVAGQHSSWSQGMQNLKTSRSSGQVLPSQSSSLSQGNVPDTGRLNQSVLQFSDAPLLGPSISSVSQQAQDTVASFGAHNLVSPSTSNALQYTQSAAAESAGISGLGSEQAQTGAAQSSETEPSSSAQAERLSVVQQQHEQSARTESGALREGWFQNDLYSDDTDPGLHNLRDPDLERRGSHAGASPSASSSPRGPINLRRMSQQVNQDVQAEEEERARLRQARLQRADRAAAAANAAVKADLKAMEDAQKESQIDPKNALITLAAGLAVRYYLMDIIKLLVILAILLGDASFVAVLYIRSQLSLELSLGIVFFVNMALALAILIYIATGVNTDIFIWIKDYAQSLKEDDSAVAQKKDSTLMKLAAMEGAVPKQLQPTFKKVMQKLQQVGKKDKPKQRDDSDSESSFRQRSPGPYNDVNDETGRQKSPYSPLATLNRLSRGPSRGARGVSFAKRSNRGVSQRRQPGGQKKTKDQPDDYMSKAKQLWTYVGKFTGLETAEASQMSGTGEELTPPSAHSRSFGQWGSNNSRTSKPRPGPSRFGRPGSAANLKDDYKSAVMLLRAEEGDADKQPSQQTSVRIDSITQQQ